jgi:hypothetical protein
MPAPFLCSEDCPAASDISVFSGKVVNLAPSELCIIVMSFVEFRLEEIELVDETMKRVTRKWEVPNETYPVGISADGRTLYLPVEFTEGDQDANMWLLWRHGKKSYPSSVLAISPTGSRFEGAAKALVDQNI